MTRLEVDPGRPGDAACTDIARARAPHHQSRDGIVGTTARRRPNGISRRAARHRGDGFGAAATIAIHLARFRSTTFTIGSVGWRRFSLGPTSPSRPQCCATDNPLRQ